MIKGIKEKIKRFWFLSLPLIHIHLEMPFIEIRTMVMYRYWDRMAFTYSAFQIKIFKWEFYIDIFEDEHHRMLRKNK